MTRIILVVVAAFFLSCAPRFTVYLDLHDRMNTTGITPLEIDTVIVQGRTHRMVRYAETKDVGYLERLFLRRIIRNAQKELDKISR